ncbi:unnamed protein product [Mytilus coruscus]|uniref:Uncharacterized protein n=1 Tax=Mytilus coruscus TaxID=42192 RepID=A0A6J8DPG8_MYTCO|nr:unnamed protein product [Mytilus coruscus]
MSFIRFITIAILLNCILLTNSATVCNFDFSIPNVGPSCEMKGGLPSDLIDKYHELFGGVEGLKLIVDDRKGLGKITQDQFSKIQRDQQIYAQNINQIANEIQTVKHQLGIHPVAPEPTENEDAVQDSKISKRAVDPYKALRAALQDAELKLANMTNNMNANARQQSIIFSTVEQRVQQQDLRLMTILQKISDLEKLAAALPASQQSQTGGISSPSFKTVMNIATISAKIQATTEIIQARVMDLNERLKQFQKPMQERSKNYQDLDSNLKRLQAGVSKLTTDSASLQLTYNKFKSDVTKDLAPIKQNMNSDNQKYKTIDSDFNGVLTKIQNEEADLQKHKQLLQQASAQITQLKTQLPPLDHDLQNITSSINTMKQDPLVLLGHLKSNETVVTKKLDKDTAQASRMLTSIGGMIQRVNGTLNNIPQASG